jgi:hypothetical protein
MYFKQQVCFFCFCRKKNKMCLFANIFSQPVACFLILLVSPIKEQMFLILMKSKSILSFMDHAFCVVSEKSQN